MVRLIGILLPLMRAAWLNFIQAQSRMIGFHLGSRNLPVRFVFGRDWFWRV
jgi:hypothetical protein